jgi:hypothetical protein
MIKLFHNSKFSTHIFLMITSNLGELEKVLGGLFTTYFH